MDLARTHPKRTTDAIRELDDLDRLMKHELFERRKIEGVAVQLDELERMTKHECSSAKHGSHGHPYQYVHIKPGLRIIRLLELTPGVSETELKGRLLYVPLGSKSLPYEALSYVWGSPMKTQTIKLRGGLSLPITTSLYAALQRFRDLKQNKLIWVDALCINQEDTVEKSAQIMFMANIYAYAKRTLIWLGNDNDRKDGQNSLRYIKMRARTSVKEHQAIGIGDREYNQLLFLFGLPWFRRSWVVQELVMSKEAVFICGEAEISWQDMLFAGHAFRLVLSPAHVIFGATEQTRKTGAIRAHRLDKANVATSVLAHAMDLRMSRIPAAVQELHTRQCINGEFVVPTIRTQNAPDTWLYDTFFCHMPRKLAHELFDIAKPYGLTATMQHYENNGYTEDSWLHGRTDFPQLVTGLHACSATDPRDKLFAFLGLSSEHELPELRPDYDQPVDVTYRRYAKCLLTIYDNLFAMNTLLDAGIQCRARNPREVPSYLLSLPSWIPHWSTSRRSDGLGFGAFPSGSELLKHPFRASGTTKAKIAFGRHEDELLVLGTYLDSIVRVLPSPFSPPRRHASDRLPSDHKLSNVYKWLQKVDNLFAAHNLGEETKWRTMIGNLLKSRNTFYIPDVDEAHHYQVMRAFTDMCLSYENFMGLDGITMWYAGLADYQHTHLHEQGAETWMTRWQQVSQLYEICETKKGMIGLVPRGSVVGDQIFVLYSGHVPFVMRPVMRGYPPYTLVGGCYVNGIMDGEAMEGRYEEVEICLV